MDQKQPKMTTYQQEISDRIGGCSLKYIDGAWSLWKKLNDHYDIEILGSYCRSDPFTVVIYDISRGEWHPPVVERYDDIASLAALEHIVTEANWKYSARAKA